MTHHSWIELDRQALINNFNLFSGKLGQSAFVPVVKGNAYGHGLKQVLEIILPLKPNWLAVNSLEEAQVVRDCGFQERLLVVGPSLKEDFDLAYKLDAELILGQIELLEEWLDSNQKPFLHIKIDTGLARQGVSLNQWKEILPKFVPQPQRLLGLSTHFANVEDVTSNEYALSQLNVLQQAYAAAQCYGLTLIRHAASSASSLLIEQSHLDLGRIGISFYGLWPSEVTRMSYRVHHQELFGLKPVLSWRSRLTTIRDIPADTYVGYGLTFKSSQSMTIGVVPVGYYEGYPRLAGDHGSYVLIQGKRCAILGRICMNMMIVDLSSLTKPQLGERVTLIGADGKESISADKLAEWAQTIHYELVTRINSNLSRVIV